ncbi:UDP-2,3-diacylglucosamine diphosphatase [Sulfurimonas lithotrophica]|uniref:UDP-2,3-diacylglucosamine diphosphatase n=1 Tax=Sulfurimonas lithotrophica TaxID=2590022 RepID=A0A5P8P246_9BACT|nr:UDP-2,3-diacylglucosamine diphosphatase [Sulfurimonas lithotrophica]QFR49754.1 UDP-2,3-diacylglucosamine diphosphatase [Sulfurimonas lithotrophica]
MIEIKEGAFIVSDAHYSRKRLELLNFFKDIQNKKLKPTQLILMGDMFDLLFGGINRTVKRNQELVDILNEISKDIELIYLEGNHDFNLKKVFKNAKVFKISQQPVECVTNGKKTYLAHGDFASNTGYKVYTAVIRNRFVLFVLNIINIIFNNIILKKLDFYLDKKDDCNTIENFEKIIKNRLDEKFECEYFIEGHFHQNKKIEFEKFHYINLAAFACNQRYFIVRFANKELLHSNKYLGD